MLLKRIYDKTDPKHPKVNGIKILRAGPRQNFSPELLQQGVTQGWLSMAAGKITLHAQGGDAAYRIVRGPGYYCCHCGAPMDDGAAARAHLAESHAGQKSPDASNPAGYCRLNHYECEKEK